MISNLSNITFTIGGIFVDLKCERTNTTYLPKSFNEGSGGTILAW